MEDPIGKGLFRGDSVRHTVVGVVRDVPFEICRSQTDMWFQLAKMPLTTPWRYPVAQEVTPCREDSNRSF